MIENMSGIFIVQLINFDPANERYFEMADVDVISVLESFAESPESDRSWVVV